tara:strand:- start:350 stop:568 length:219 start_codon:yes stop_codon:yes gene_type:complete
VKKESSKLSSEFEEETSVIVPGDLCYYFKTPVLVLKVLLNGYDDSGFRKRCHVLFPQGGIDTVSLKSLKVIE